MPPGNRALHAAAIARADEFYTQMADIAAELKHYKKHFVGKVVFCNCDDPFESNFFKFFALNFNAWGLKKLICTCYDGSAIAGTELSLFDEPEPTNKKPYKVELTEVRDINEDGATDLLDIKEILKLNSPTLLKGNGDFRSEECVELLKEADIVVTNPPFSLFREYVAQLIKYEKKFLILGNQNAITYKEIFPLIRDNKMWLGYKAGDMAFAVPEYYEPRATRFWVDEYGQKWRSLGNICWYTNLDHKKRHDEIDLYKQYSPNEYPKYDNYDAIEVGKVADIPIDYKGWMGVPITFLDKYNPEQFEIYGNAKQQNADNQKVIGGGGKLSQDCLTTQKTQRLQERVSMQESLFATSITGMIKNAEGKINGRITYARIIIRKKGK